METFTLVSSVFSNSRQIRVWLPEAYQDSGRENALLPVLYLNDGQNLFDSTTAVFGHAEWEVDETVSSLISTDRIPPIIVVGIDNAGRKGRAREYLPYPDEFLDPPEPDPQGDRYADFLASEVLPAVEARFRVRRDRAGRHLGGSSYGALVSLAVAASRPDLFSGLLLESPSLYVSDAQILSDVAARGLELSRVYIGVGTNELGVPNCGPHPGSEEAVEHVRRLAGLLAEQGLDEQNLHVYEELCAVHHESAWARRLPAALEFLFREGGAR